MDHKLIISTAYKVLKKFPRAKNGQYFLTLKNGRKVFMNRFVRKYGLNGSLSKYKKSDVARRVKLVEFFEYFMQLETIPMRQKNKFWFNES